MERGGGSVFAREEGGDSGARMRVEAWEGSAFIGQEGRVRALGGRRGAHAEGRGGGDALP